MLSQILKGAFVKPYIISISCGFRLSMILNT